MSRALAFHWIPDRHTALTKAPEKSHKICSHYEMTMGRFFSPIIISSNVYVIGVIIPCMCTLPYAFKNALIYIPHYLFLALNGFGGDAAPRTE